LRLKHYPYQLLTGNQRHRGALVSLNSHSFRFQSDFPKESAKLVLWFSVIVSSRDLKKESKKEMTRMKGSSQSCFPIVKTSNVLAGNSQG
jgi:hypothetical protein